MTAGADVREDRSLNFISRENVPRALTHTNSCQHSSNQQLPATTLCICIVLANLPGRPRFQELSDTVLTQGAFLTSNLLAVDRYRRIGQPAHLDAPALTGRQRVPSRLPTLSPRLRLY